ncbi:MAG: hypothetical protein IRD7MM_03065 [Candidatus Midichloria mitochondrii]|nr:hypothetical protein [Candidatus Midichloria mitochondrii]MDJ1255989.1 hypothetical protein [Candidatus Midichloria mitochondrii]MDJ1287931.1 hypothetical protein [Candidatus Midichloria mitochondrii]MDJ1298518.1 hypothetical protein [Candidatus Midichloria mitochondrii]MDJ1312669.1 hypothetical protein [Candidatus Midichloria mitochondrii]MDJ1583196.1 hypothetical protein [Candidatus Midichloria mitochondrii]
MTILLGDGNGSFQQAVYYNIGNRPEGVRVAGLDGGLAPDKSLPVRVLI